MINDRRRLTRGAELDRRSPPLSGRYTHLGHFVPSPSVVSRCAVLPPVLHASRGTFTLCYMPLAVRSLITIAAAHFHACLATIFDAGSEVSRSAPFICACVTQTSVRQAAASFHAMLPHTHFGVHTCTFAFPMSMRRGAVGRRLCVRSMCETAIACLHDEHCTFGKLPRMFPNVHVHCATLCKHLAQFHQHPHRRVWDPSAPRPGTVFGEHKPSPHTTLADHPSGLGEALTPPEPAAL